MRLTPQAEILVDHTEAVLERLERAEAEQTLPALLARDFDLVIAEEYPGNPNPRPAELEQEDLCDDPLRLARPQPADAKATRPHDAEAALRRWLTIRG
ncbi:hypothetical protein ABT294_16235 [Nonomuraea sp. NPDC000554]|uniref:hypothetical protein n=1 Tax=Nonomuraea sp. NPDC000554 TaxID=3154259 RepID=UPI00332C84B2